jgi:signal transduction histidine kinase
LGTLKTSAELLERQVAADNGIAREMAGYITQEVDRINSLITRFLDFARPRNLRMQKANLHSMLDQAIDRFDREKTGEAASVTVFKNYSPDVPPVNIETELMEHVITNLLSNAAQASPAGAVVTVKTRLADTPEGQKAEIAVIDRGSGIDPKHLENIFNPFFTTKAAGVGLGLSIVSKIVDEHGGLITVESTPGEGSVFHVYLPVAE